MSSDNDYIGIVFNRRHIVLNNCSDRADGWMDGWRGSNGRHPRVGEQSVRKKKRAAKRERGQEGMSWWWWLRGFMKEDLGSTVFGNYFWGVFCVQRGFEVSHSEG